MPMGSLFALLHGHRDRGVSRTPLNWDIRSGIALGAARAIGYLHSQGPLMSHGNIKSSNILLTSTFEARVSDNSPISLDLPLLLTVLLAIVPWRWFMLMKYPRKQMYIVTVYCSWNC